MQIEGTANLNLCNVVLRCWRLLWNQTDVYAYFGVIVLQIKLTIRISITFEKYNLLKLQISKKIFFLYNFDSFFENKNFWNWNGNVKFGGCFFLNIVLILYHLNKIGRFWESRQFWSQTSYLIWFESLKKCLVVNLKFTWWVEIQNLQHDNYHKVYSKCTWQKLKSKK